MARILQLIDDRGAPISDAALLVDDELADYLAALSDFPALASLRAYPAEGETRIDPEPRRALAGEIAPFAARARARDLPEPPDWVGLEGGTDIRLGEELGWRGLLHFLQQLERLLTLADRLRGEIWVMGE
jgi:hypothetical protein